MSLMLDTTLPVLIYLEVFLEKRCLYAHWRWALQPCIDLLDMIYEMIYTKD